VSLGAGLMVAVSTLMAASVKLCNSGTIVPPSTYPSSSIISPSSSISSSSSLPSAPSCGVVRLGTWNVSWWQSSRLPAIDATGVQLLAVQETKLSLLPLEHVKTSLRRTGYTLHHGHPVEVRTTGGYGDSCGVGVLASPGVAVSPLLPQGAAWRRLYAMSRVHAVQVPAREGLPLGLRVFSVYAPLHGNPILEMFRMAFLEMVSSLDLQIPTLLMGDFNGTISPERDYSSGLGHISPLLARLLGPAGAFLDLQLVVSPGEYAPTFRHRRGEETRTSRCDLVLGSHSVLPLVEKVFVESGACDGGHSPVVVELRSARPWAISWLRPAPHLPALLLLPSSCLRESEPWAKLMEAWLASAPVQRLLGKPSATTASQLSAILQASLEQLVSLSGGWIKRPSHRRPAYESDEARHVRATLRLLGHASALLHREWHVVGPFSCRLKLVVAKLQQKFAEIPAFSRCSLLNWVEAQIATHRSALSAAVRQMREERKRRWQACIPTL